MEAAPGPREATQGTKFTLELLLFQLTLALGASILSHSPVGEQFQTLQESFQIDTLALVPLRFGGANQLDVHVLYCQKQQKVASQIQMCYMF